MPVRLRITLLFSIVVFIIIGLVCCGIYYSSSALRKETIKTRLTNRAITTGRLLSTKLFDQTVVQKVDSFTKINLKNKTVQVYDDHYERIYNYSDIPGDTLQITRHILDQARLNGSYDFTAGEKEAVAYNYQSPQFRAIIIASAEDAEGKRNLRSLLKLLAVAFIAGNLLVVIAGYFFSGKLLLPIKRISKEVAEISAHNLGHRIHTGVAKDEWFRLTSTFNELLDGLQDSLEVHQRFIANASHELSTPLTSISSQLEVAMQRDRNAEHYLQVMKSVHQDVQHLSKLTQTLLELAKASGSKTGLEFEPVRMDEIILKLPAEISNTVGECEVKLDFCNLPEDEEKLLVFGSEPLLFSAVKNIVSNACKYSHDHRAIVTLSASDRSVVICVGDKGIGIPEDEMEKVFYPFYRGENNLQSGGFGLGLSIAARIIKIHNGTIEVESTKQKGTTFKIILPNTSRLL